MTHTCHWPSCNKAVPPANWGCSHHWYKLPKHLRDRIWATYRLGQEITKTPSAEYIAAAAAVQQWIATHLAPPIADLFSSIPEADADRAFREAFVEQRD